MCLDMLNDQNLDLNKLRIFTAIYESKSVTKAGERLRVTPSAVSQSLTQLESELGFHLFQRISKKLLPTAQADSLFSVVQKYNVELGEYLIRARESKNTISGLLKIGAPPEFGSRQVVQCASSFFKHKDARFQIEFGLPDDLLQKVVSQELDFAFCDGGPYLKKYSKLVVYQTVFKEEAVLVCSREFFQKEVKGDFSYGHLSSLPHSDYRSDSKVINLWYEHHFGKVPTSMDLRFSASHVNAMVQAALAGMGLVFIPTHLIQAELKTKKLIAIPTKKSAYVNPIVLVQKADKVPTLLERKFISTFIDEAQHISP